MRLSRFANLLALGGYLGLAISVAVWYGLCSASTRLGFWLPLILLAPLLPALPGLLRRQTYTHAWMSLLTLIYLGWSLTEALSNPPVRNCATAAVIASLVLFTGCVCFVRFSARERNAGLSP